MQHICPHLCSRQQGRNLPGPGRGCSEWKHSRKARQTISAGLCILVGLGTSTVALPLTPHPGLGYHGHASCLEKDREQHPRSSSCIPGAQAALPRAGKGPAGAGAAPAPPPDTPSATKFIRQISTPQTRLAKPASRASPQARLQRELSHPISARAASLTCRKVKTA